MTPEENILAQKERLDQHVESDGKKHDQSRRRTDVLAGVVVFLFLVVTVLGVGVVKYARDANDTANGTARASCALIRLIEQGADQQSSSAATQKKIIDKLPKNDPTLPERRKAQKAARKQVKTLNQLAADMREGVTCPPRGVHSLKGS